MLFVFLITICISLCTVSVVSIWWATRKRNRIHLSPARAEAISVLKPLCGADDALLSNLESFFELDHPNYELIFGVQGADDPAIEVVRQLQEKYPHTNSRLVVHNGGRALNPKVSNLRAMLEDGSADVLIVSDSNVAVRPDYLTAMQAELAQAGTGLVTSPIVGVGERSLGAVMENLHLAGTIAGSVCASRLLNRTLVVGKSMMFRRSVFERLGGFGAVSNLLAEDYIIGRMFHQAGYQVRLCPLPILNVVQDASVGAFAKRHLRWTMLRTRLKPLIYPFEILANPMTMALATPWLGMGAWPLILGACLSMARDGLSLLRLRGPRGMWAVLPVSPLKDLITLGVWALAPFRRHVGWRGNRLRLSAGTWLYAEQAMPRPIPVRCDP